MSARGSIVIVSPYRIEYGPPQTLAHVARAIADAGFQPVCLVPDKARRVGELIAVHVIPRPHASLEDVLPIGKAGTK